ncbi:MAG: hypothetical protein KY452_08635, partial [Actinobacteria bacterium]|nr:hypothetical protein [Actinomycetota bacterium]
WTGADSAPFQHPEAVSHLRRTVGAMWSLLLPPSCGGCGRPGPAPCPTCWRALAAAPPVGPVPGLDRCRALLRYEGAGRELLARLKYRNARSSVPFLARGMAAVAPPGVRWKAVM